MVVADANSVFRSGVVGVLARETGIRAVPAATTEALIGLVDKFQPAVVLADVDLPPGAAGSRRSCGHAARADDETVAIASDPDREARPRSRTGGRARHHRADGAIDHPRLDRAAAAAGRDHAPAPPLGHVLDALARAERGSTPVWPWPPSPIASAKSLALIGKGRRNREIADILSISELTVKCHVHNMLEKLRVPTRAAAVSLAVAAERWPPTDAQLRSAQASSTTER